MRREFAERFKDEVITVSCNDMNKLNVGGGRMVSQYHQINRIFMTMILTYWATKFASEGICHWSSILKTQSRSK